MFQATSFCLRPYQPSGLEISIIVSNFGEKKEYVSNFNFGGKEKVCFNFQWIKWPGLETKRKQGNNELCGYQLSSSKKVLHSM